MSPWAIATWALLPALVLPIVVALRHEAATRLVALQFVTGITALLLTLMSFAFDQPSYLDLALTVALLAVPGTLLMAIFIERWL